MIPLHHLHRSTAIEVCVRQEQTLTPSHAAAHTVPPPPGPLLRRAPRKRVDSGLSTLGQTGRLATALGHYLEMCVFVVEFEDKHRHGYKMPADKTGK